MIFGYKANYNRQQWMKLLSSITICGLFLIGYAYTIVEFLDASMPWVNYLLELFAENGVPESIIAEIKDPNINTNDVILWLLKQSTVLVLIFSSSFIVVIYFGYRIAGYLSSLVIRKLHLNNGMRLSFRKVNPSKLDPLINWLKK